MPITRPRFRITFDLSVTSADRYAIAPERRLAVAVLEGAIHDLHLSAHRYWTRGATSYADEARDWIASDDTLWPYSFVNLCDALGMDAPRLRARLLEGIPRRARSSRRPVPTIRRIRFG